MGKGDLFYGKANYLFDLIKNTGLKNAFEKHSASTYLIEIINRS